jgi:hypothetical protein
VKDGHFELSKWLQKGWPLWGGDYAVNQPEPMSGHHGGVCFFKFNWEMKH